MREIKFRAWDKSAGQFYFIEPNYILGIRQDGTVWETPARKEAGFQSPHNRTDDFVIQQFTGLHDKNGKEIYEGDVIGPIGEAPAFAVEWEKAGYWNCMRVPEMEVIGNIYENEELLR